MTITEGQRGQPGAGNAGLDHDKITDFIAAGDHATNGVDDAHPRGGYRCAGGLTSQDQPVLRPPIVAATYKPVD